MSGAPAFTGSVFRWWYWLPPVFAAAFPLCVLLLLYSSDIINGDDDGIVYWRCISTLCCYWFQWLTDFVLRHYYIVYCMSIFVYYVLFYYYLFVIVMVIFIWHFSMSILCVVVILYYLYVNVSCHIIVISVIHFCFYSCIHIVIVMSCHMSCHVCHFSHVSLYVFCYSVSIIFLFFLWYFIYPIFSPLPTLLFSILPRTHAAFARRPMSWPGWFDTYSSWYSLRSNYTNTPFDIYFSTTRHLSFHVYHHPYYCILYIVCVYSSCMSCHKQNE